MSREALTKVYNSLLPYIVFPEKTEGGATDAGSSASEGGSIPDGTVSPPLHQLLAHAGAEAALETLLRTDDLSSAELKILVSMPEVVRDLQVLYLVRKLHAVSILLQTELSETLQGLSKFPRKQQGLSAAEEEQHQVISTTAAKIRVELQTVSEIQGKLLRQAALSLDDIHNLRVYTAAYAVTKEERNE